MFMRLFSNSNNVIIFVISFLSYFMSGTGFFVRGQCYNYGASYPASTQYISAGQSDVTISTCNYGGEYATCWIETGKIYTFYTCGDTDFDTQLTAKTTASTSGGTVVAYNDDYCGVQSQIQFTASYTGYVYVLVSKYNCSNVSTCMTLKWSCAAPACSGPGTANTSGSGSWYGSVYKSNSAGTFSTYKGYVTESETFNRTHSSPTGAVTDVCADVGEDLFAIRYKMSKNFTAGYYTFTVGGDDGVRLSLDGGSTWHINDWTDHGYATYSSSSPVYLSGNTNLVFEYYENTGGAQSSFSYSCVAPLQPSAIVGSMDPAVGSTQTYSVTNVGGITYTWSFPAGWTITSGQGTNSVNVTVGGSNGTISCTPSTACGSGTARTNSTTIPNYRAQMVSASYGSSDWCNGEERNVTVQIKNTGVATWNSAYTTNVGVKWNDWSDYHSRVTAGALAPGATADYTLPIKALNANSGPSYTTDLSVGSHTLTFDVVNEGSCWFGNNNGSCGGGNAVLTTSSINVKNGPTSVSAGSDASYCVGSSETLGASATGALMTDELYNENFNACSGLLNPSICGWTYGTFSIADSYTYWKISSSCAVSGNALTLYDDWDGQDCDYDEYGFFTDPSIDFIAYPQASIDATGYQNIKVSFDWKCVGEVGYDYGNIMYSFDGSLWYYANATDYVNQGTWTSESFTLPSAVNNTNFYIGFRWRNDGSDGGGVGSAFSIDNIQITGERNETISYSWSPSTDLSSTSISNPVASPSTTTTYTVTATSNGCSSTDEVEISVDAPVTTSINSDLTANDSYIWTGATNSTWSTASNWDKYNGSNWVSTASAPGTNDKVFVLDDAGQNCIMANDPTGSGTISSLTIKSGANLTLSGTFTVNNDFLNEGTIDLSSRTLDVKGNFTNNGILTEGTGTVSLSGSSAQTVAGSDLGFYNLTVNNLNGITMANTGSVSGNLNLTNGVVNLGNNNLTIGNSGSISVTSPSSSKMINTSGTGELRKHYAQGSGQNPAAFLFPIGTTGEYSPVQLDFTNVDFGADAYMRVRVEATRNANMNSSQSSYLDRNWIVEPNDVTNYTYNIRYQYVENDFNDGGLTVDEIVPIKYSSGQWYQPDGLLTPFSNAVNESSDYFSFGTFGDPTFGETLWLYWDGLQSFSEFGGAGQTGQPLPVELVSFSGACDEGVISLTWQTASEFNSSHFEVEKSRDGENWQTLSIIPSAGTSNELITYQSTDQNGTGGNNYFRLRQVDIDGTDKLYNPINVSCSDNKMKLFLTHPNPSKNIFQLTLNNEDLVGECTLNIIDAQGKFIEQRKIEVKEGINMFVINQEMNPGIYFINITNGNNSTPILRHAIK